MDLHFSVAVCAAAAAAAKAELKNLKEAYSSLAAKLDAISVATLPPPPPESAEIGGQRVAAGAATAPLRSSGLSLAVHAAEVIATHADVKALRAEVDKLTTKRASFRSATAQPAAVDAADAAVAAAQVELILAGGMKGRALQRVLAYAQANAAADGFAISAKLAGRDTGPATRGMRRPPVEVSRATIGAPAVLEIVATRDCYFYVIEQDSAGGLVQVAPNNAGQVELIDNRLAAGEMRKLPEAAKGDAFVITFCAPAGWETIFVFATRTPWREWDAMVSGARDQPAAVEEKLARGVVARGMRARPAATAPADDNFTVAACTHVFELFKA